VRRFKPKFLVVGDADDVIPLQQFCELIKDVAEPKQYQVVSGADHFWRRHGELVAKKVTDFFTTGFIQI